MNAPLRAHSLNEISYYLMVVPCGACGKGPHTAETADAAGRRGQLVTVQVRCGNCRQAWPLSFTYDHDLPAEGAESHAINPTDQPSRIIDLHQWLSLFYFLMESAWKTEAAPLVRRSGFQAALCLAEALKFYGEEDMPPPSAFFSPQGQAAFRDHPDKFSKARLRDMQGKLPALPRMARRVERDGRRRKRKWWPF